MARGRARGGRARRVIDATNAARGRTPGYESLAHQLKARTGGPVAKAFNLNFARAYGEVQGEPKAPGNLFAADDEARALAEQLSRDAGYEPVYVGGLDRARALEEFLAPLFGISEDRGGPVFYGFYRPGER